MKRGALEVVWDEGEAEFAYQHPGGGGRPLLELAPVPSWHELQFRPVGALRLPRRAARARPLRDLPASSSRSACSRSLVLRRPRSRAFSPERRAQALGVVVFATIGEVTGSLIWGVYTYRLHNLPLFVPPAHGLVYLTGLSLAIALRSGTRRALVAAAAVAAATWGVLGLTVLPQRDVAGALGVPLLLLFLWRSPQPRGLRRRLPRRRALELYGTAIGTWRWAPELPGLGIPDGNPPSGVASGYVWFDVMALLDAPLALVARQEASSSPNAE